MTTNKAPMTSQASNDTSMNVFATETLLTFVIGRMSVKWPWKLKVSFQFNNIPLFLLLCTLQYSIPPLCLYVSERSFFSAFREKGSLGLRFYFVQPFWWWNLFFFDAWPELVCSKSYSNRKKFYRRITWNPRDMVKPRLSCIDTFGGDHISYCSSLREGSKTAEKPR